MQEEGIKEKSNLKKGCLGIIIGIILFLIICDTILGLISGTIFIRKEVYGKVIDKETNKSIVYALISTACLPDLGSVQVIADKKGFYKIKRKLVWSGALRGTEWGWKKIERNSQVFSCWFPGYKKYETKTQGRELLSGKLDIYLERPKTVEEAVEVLRERRGSIENCVFPKGFSKEEINKEMKEKGYRSYAELVWNVLIETEVNTLLRKEGCGFFASTESKDSSFERIMEICQNEEVRTCKDLIKKIPCEELNKMKNPCYRFKKL